MAMAMVRRRIAGYAKVKKKRIPVPRRMDPNEQMVGEEAVVRVYAPSAAVGRAVEAKPWWHGIWKPLAIGSGVTVGCLIAFFVMKAPGGDSSSRSAERNEYHRSVSLPHSRTVGAVEVRRGGASFAGERAAPQEVVLSQRSAPSVESFRAAGYTRKKVYLPEISGNCTIGGGGAQDITECLRQQAGSGE